MRETFILEDVLNAMIGLETAGNVNYESLARMTADPEAHSLFELLARQELRHKEIYEGFRAELLSVEEPDGEYADYVRMLLKHHFDFLKEESAPNDFEAGFRKAVQLEKDTIFFLNEMKPILGKGRERQLELLLAEERKHLEYLTNYRK